MSTNNMSRHTSLPHYHNPAMRKPPAPAYRGVGRDRPGPLNDFENRYGSSALYNALDNTQRAYDTEGT